MRKTVLVVWFALLLSPFRAAYAMTWNPGKVILRDGTELAGDLNFNWKAEIVQFRQADRIRAFSIDQISNFVYFDNQQNSLRKFVAIDNCPLREHGRPQFLEEVANGSLMVYRSLRINHNAVKAANFDADGNLTKATNAFVYLVFTGDEWHDFNQFYRQRWPQLMASYQDELNPYTKMRGLNLNMLVGRLVLICKYNALMARTISHGSSTDESVLTTDQAYEE